MRWVEVIVEVPRGSWVKRGAEGQVDYVSPLPSPFNYGSVPTQRGGDGDPLDAVVLGPRLERGTRVQVPVRGVVLLRDAGQVDDKLICSAQPLTRAQRALIQLFFHAYRWGKGPLNRWRGLSGPTRFEGWAAQERDLP